MTQVKRSRIVWAGLVAALGVDRTVRPGDALVDGLGGVVLFQLLVRFGEQEQALERSLVLGSLVSFVCVGQLLPSGAGLLELADLASSQV